MANEEAVRSDENDVKRLMSVASCYVPLRESTLSPILFPLSA